MYLKNHEISIFGEGVVDGKSYGVGVKNVLFIWDIHP